MKKLCIPLFIIALLCSCSSPQSEQEKLITDFLETNNGVKTDLQIKYSKFDISNILVSDSVAILQAQFEAERAKKIESIESTIKHKENSIAEQRSKKNKVVSNSLIRMWEDDIANQQRYLEETKNWRPNYLSKYDSKNESDILVQRADITFSYFNPKLQVKQEVSAFVLLSADGKQCLRMQQFK